MEKIVLTGSAGFLGNYVKNLLVADNYEVVDFDLPDGRDITNREQVFDILKESQPVAVIHLAAIADLNICHDKPELCEKVNIEGTKNILDACNKYNIRLLFASTCCCYGNTPYHPSDETCPIYPTEIYARSKETGETMILASGKNHTCMRLATFYGPNMRAALAHQVFLDKVVNDQEIEIHGDGKQTRTYTFVGDIANGIVTILKNTEKWYPVVNITNTETWSVLELAELAMEACGKRVPLRFVKDREGQIYKEEISNDRLCSLGWKPTISLPDGMKLCYNSMQK